MSALACVPDADASVDVKRTASLVARAALAGWELHRLSDQTFVVRRWGVFRLLDSVAAAERFIDCVEGQP